MQRSEDDYTVKVGQALNTAKYYKDEVLKAYQIAQKAYIDAISAAKDKNTDAEVKAMVVAMEAAGAARTARDNTVKAAREVYNLIGDKKPDTIDVSFKKTALDYAAEAHKKCIDTLIRAAATNRQDLQALNHGSAQEVFTLLELEKFVFNTPNIEEIEEAAISTSTPNLRAQLLKNINESIKTIDTDIIDISRLNNFIKEQNKSISATDHLNSLNKAKQKLLALSTVLATAETEKEWQAIEKEYNAYYKKFIGIHHKAINFANKVRIQAGRERREPIERTKKPTEKKQKQVVNAAKKEGKNEDRIQRRETHQSSLQAQYKSDIAHIELGVTRLNGVLSELLQHQDLILEKPEPNETRRIHSEIKEIKFSLLDLKGQVQEDLQNISEGKAPIHFQDREAMLASYGSLQNQANRLLQSAKEILHPTSEKTADLQATKNFKARQTSHEDAKLHEEPRSQDEAKEEIPLSPPPNLPIYLLSSVENIDINEEEKEMVLGRLDSVLRLANNIFQEQEESEEIGETVEQLRTLRQDIESSQIQNINEINEAYRAILRQSSLAKSMGLEAVFEIPSQPVQQAKGKEKASPKTDTDQPKTQHKNLFPTDYFDLEDNSTVGLSETTPPPLWPEVPPSTVENWPMPPNSLFTQSYPETVDAINKEKAEALAKENKPPEMAHDPLSQGKEATLGDAKRGLKTSFENAKKRVGTTFENARKKVDAVREKRKQRQEDAKDAELARLTRNASSRGPDPYRKFSNPPLTKRAGTTSAPPQADSLSLERDSKGLHVPLQPRPTAANTKPPVATSSSTDNPLNGTQTRNPFTSSYPLTDSASQKAYEILPELIKNALDRLGSINQDIELQMLTREFDMISDEAENTAHLQYYKEIAAEAAILRNFFTNDQELINAANSPDNSEEKLKAKNFIDSSLSQLEKKLRNPNPKLPYVEPNEQEREKRESAKFQLPPLPTDKEAHEEQTSGPSHLSPATGSRTFDEDQIDYDELDSNEEKQYSYDEFGDPGKSQDSQDSYNDELDNSEESEDYDEFDYDEDEDPEIDPHSEYVSKMEKARSPRSPEDLRRIHKMFERYHNELLPILQRQAAEARFSRPVDKAKIRSLMLEIAKLKADLRQYKNALENEKEAKPGEPIPFLADKGPERISNRIAAANEDILKLKASLAELRKPIASQDWVAHRSGSAEMLSLDDSDFVVQDEDGNETLLDRAAIDALTPARRAGFLEAKLHAKMAELAGGKAVGSQPVDFALASGDEGRKAPTIKTTAALQARDKEKISLRHDIYEHKNKDEKTDVFTAHRYINGKFTAESYSIGPSLKRSFVSKVFGSQDATPASAVRADKAVKDFLDHRPTNEKGLSIIISRASLSKEEVKQLIDACIANGVQPINRTKYTDLKVPTLRQAAAHENLKQGLYAENDTQKKSELRGRAFLERQKKAIKTEEETPPMRPGPGGGRSS